MRRPSFLVSSLAAFAVGVCTLQRQSELPRVWLWGLIAVLAWALSRYALRRRCVPGAPAAAAACNPALAGAACLLPVLAGAFAVGFGYAAWRAEMRLAERAAARVGRRGHRARRRRSTNCRSRSDRGTRFAFAVKRSRPRGDRPAATVAGMVRAVAEGRPGRSGAGRRRRRALAARRPAEAAARQRQSARLRRRGVAAGERVRATGYVRRGDPTSSSMRSPAARRDYVQRARTACARASSARCRMPLCRRDRRSRDRRAARDFRGAMAACSTGPASRTWFASPGLHVTVFAALAGGARVRARAAQRAPDQPHSGAAGRGAASA